MFAGRTAWNLSPNRLTALLDSRRASGLPLIDLTQTNPTRCGFHYPEAEILRVLGDRQSLVYEPSPRGLVEARRAVAEQYRSRGVSVAPGSLVLTASTSEAYAFLFRLLADPGDTMLVPAPCYPLFDLLAQIHDVALAHYELSADADRTIDPSSLARAAAAAGARAVIVVSPGNPTGRYLRRRDLETIAEVCAGRQMALICDEVFGDYDFDEAGADGSARAGSLASHPDLLTFTLDGLSKMLGLPQLKLGWIAASGPAPLVSGALERLEVIADTYLSVNTPVQHALAGLLALRPAIQDQVMARLKTNRAELKRRVAQVEGLRVTPAEGGWQSILEVPSTRTDEAWALEILSREGVLVHPGYFFDFPGEGHLVISLLPPPDIFAEGVDRMLRCIRGQLDLT